MQSHSKATNTRLAAEKALTKPKQVNIVEVVPKKVEIGKLFKADRTKVIIAISQLTELQINELENALKESK